MVCLWAVTVFVAGSRSLGQTPYQSSADFEKDAMKLREKALRALEPATMIPTTARPESLSNRYPWKTGIVTTLFWIGRLGKDKAGHVASAWDGHWQKSYGGYDDPNPAARHDFMPSAFTPGKILSTRRCRTTMWRRARRNRKRRS
jgi:hypothetical protein